MFDAALNRISSRTFQKTALSHDDIDKIATLLLEESTNKGPFDHSFEFTYYLDKKKYRGGRRIGTYGLIKNAPLFVGATCQNDFHSIIDFGFIMEHLILKLTNEGFDTCWLGGTFRRKQFKRKLQPGEIIPAITPVGYRAETRSLIDRSVRSGAQSKRRYDMNHIFRCYDGTELSFTEDAIILQCLSLVRRAPSASNRQPWRVYVDHNKVHFYLKRTPNYPPVPLGYDIQALDIGIAICHFIIGLNHNKLEYNYLTEENPKSFDGETYILSIEISK